MNAGDPVEESGQALRTGFVQAMQTAHTTQALMGRWGGESRSRAEHEQRLATNAAKEGRSVVEHQVRVGKELEARYWDRQLNQARVDEVRARIFRGGELHSLEQRRLEAQIERADKDLERRDRAGDLDREHQQILHDNQIAGYTNREHRAVELHELDVEYKQLLIDIRRRAAGFTETLTEQTGPGAAVTASSAAAFAVADASAEMSTRQARDSEAFHGRFVEDTGVDAREFIRRASSTTATGTKQSRVSLREIAGLTAELSFATHLMPMGLIDRDPEPEYRWGERIEAAVADAALDASIEYTTAIDDDLPPELVSAPTVEPEPWQ
ncbi:hypothetical protein [Nocardia testacea]|uniref:hypothetical protein n=1 Tax=Nocardia testacea TaxID=248551 RepID=UPI003A863957